MGRTVGTDRRLLHQGRRRVTPYVRIGGFHEKAAACSASWGLFQIMGFNYAACGCKNAIEAPFIFKHGGYYYLFVSLDYCCRGKKSNYRVAVGRSKDVAGPYLDKAGKDMLNGGGTVVMEGDKKNWEAAGHCAAYTFDGQDIFICHGYSATRNGAAFLIQRPITWTPDGWPAVGLTTLPAVSAAHSMPSVAVPGGRLWKVIAPTLFG